MMDFYKNELNQAEHRVLSLKQIIDSNGTMPFESGVKRKASDADETVDGKKKKKKKGKRVSGYTQFLKEYSQGCVGSPNMTAIGVIWKAKSPEEQKVYHNKSVKERVAWIKTLPAAEQEIETQKDIKKDKAALRKFEKEKASADIVKKETRKESHDSSDDSSSSSDSSSEEEVEKKKSKKSKK
tara:strand:+ start:226 stop:774 length:549 start_codon:yes stop_codon:yes gene_type:complete